jgi:hypothetical protein
VGESENAVKTLFVSEQQPAPAAGAGPAAAAALLEPSTHLELSNFQTPNMFKEPQI